jgi:hypothetical protein
MNLKSLIGKLNDTTRGAMEAAAGLCLARTHYDIEVEHYLTKLLDSTDNDLAAILKHFEVDTSRFSGELARALDKLKSGNARTPALSPTLIKMLLEAWTAGSIDYNAGQVRTGFTILALATNDELVRLMREISREFQKIQADALRKDFAAIVANSSEEAETASAAVATAPGAPSAGARPGGKTPNLDQFTINLTEKAKTGKLDPVLGRDLEIRQVIDILMRRRQNNPILTGEAGVGKTAVVEGFALRVAQGDVPPPLRNVTVRTLDLALLQAGAGIKGEFENRLKGLIEEVKASPIPIILFIDEAHTMIGAGGQAGQGDAANLLKPALARGELRTIAATTWSEYKKYFEKDPALARRFQVVKVEEPVEIQCMTMLRGIVPSLEKHHKVRILDEGDLDGFGHPTDPVLPGQGGQKVKVVEHRRRGSKNAQKVFLPQGVDAVFHPDGGVGLGQDGGGHPDEPDSPVGRGRGEARGVDQGPAAHGRHIGMAAQSRRLHGLMEDGDLERVVLHRLAAGQEQRGAGQDYGFSMLPAIAFHFLQQVGVMPIEAAVHHNQHLFGQVAAAVPGYLLKQGIVRIEETAGKMHRISEAHLKFLLNGFHGVILWFRM